MKVTAIIRKDQPDKNKLCKIYIRINQGDKRSYVPTDIKVLATQFKKGKIVSHAGAEKLNQELSVLILSYQVAPDINRETFKTFTDRFIDDCRQNKWRTIGTVKHYKSYAKKFLDFSGDIPLHQITEKKLTEFNTHMVRKLKNHPNTIWAAFKFLKMIFRRAGISVKTPQDIKYRQSVRTYLTAEEVNKIRDLKLIGPLQKIAQWFLFQCYTGMRVGDLNRLNIHEIISSGRIVLGTSKTGELVSIPLAKEAAEILQAAGPFNMTPEHYNQQLKIIGGIAGIQKNITSHVARHTAAVRMAELKISKEVASLLLGHRKASTTDIYYKIQNARVDEEFSGFGY